MFSEVQREFIKSFVDTYRKEYPYYIAYTYTNVSDSYSYDDVSFYIIVSKNPIEGVSRYRYNLYGDCLSFAVRSGNASRTYQSERVQSVSAPSTLTVNNYEWVYTNAEFTTAQLQPDITATRAVTGDVYQGVSIALLIVLLSVVFFRMIRR